MRQRRTVSALKARKVLEWAVTVSYHWPPQFSSRLKQEARKAMASRALSKPAWESYRDRISKGLVGKRAQIEVTSLTLGDQIAAKWLPLLGITYDPKDDLLEIALEIRPSY